MIAMFVLGVMSDYIRKPLSSINHSHSIESPSPELVVKKSDVRFKKTTSARNPSSSKDDVFDKLLSSGGKGAESANFDKLLSNVSLHEAPSNFSFSSPEESEKSPCLGLFSSFSKPVNETPKLKPIKSRKSVRAKKASVHLKVNAKTSVLSETLDVEIEFEKPPPSSGVSQPAASVSPEVRRLVSTLSVATSTPVLKLSPRVFGMYE